MQRARMARSSSRAARKTSAAGRVLTAPASIAAALREDLREPRVLDLIGVDLLFCFVETRDQRSGQLRSGFLRKNEGLGQKFICCSSHEGAPLWVATHIPKDTAIRRQRTSLAKAA